MPTDRPNASDFRARLRAGSPLVLDGAVGTELERRGAECRLPLWSAHSLMRDPELVVAIHADYAAAGAEALTANTFRTQRRTLARGELGERAGELTALAVALARRACARGGFVLGSAPPLEDCYRPDLVPPDAALAREHEEHVRNLAAAGVDAILVETMNTLREAVAAMRAARDTGLPVLVSFVCGAGARLLSGESLIAALEAVVPLEPEAVLVNCLPSTRVAACLAPLRETGLPFGVYANLGAPDTSKRGRSDYATPRAFAEEAISWHRAGATLLGGCCGTTPEHLRAVARALRKSA